MDIGHNDINGVLHLPYDEMLANLPPVIVEIKKAIEVGYSEILCTLLLHMTLKKRKTENICQ